MKDNNSIDIIRRYTLLMCLLLPALLCLAGCSATLPSITPESTVRCSTVAGETPPQNAPDDCRKEICVEDRLKSIEELTESAPVSGWAEEAFCLFHPIDCFGALSVKKHVRQWEQDKANAGFWDRASLQSGLGDAARHAYLGCTLAELFGDQFAKGLLDAYEEDSSVMFGFGTGKRVNKCCDKIMDLNNNRIGVELAHQPGSCEEKVLQSLHRLRHSLCFLEQ
jgi:uncharacterized protein DUF6973